MVISIKKPAITDLAFIFYFTYSIWISVLNNFISNNIVNILATVLMIFAFAISILLTYKTRHINDVIILYLIVLILFVLTYLLNTDVRTCYWDEYWGISRMLEFSSGGIWAYLAVRLIPNNEKLLADFKIVGYITFVYYLYLLIRMLPVGMWKIESNQGNYFYSQYNMGFGYAMIFVAIVFLCLWYTRRKVLDIVIAIISATCAFLWGSRGALICLAVAVFLLLIKQLNETTYSRRTIFISVTIILLLFLLIFSQQILNVINSIAGMFGINSRTLSSLLSGNYANDVSRAEIWDMVFKRITTIFPLGLGAYGDRTVLMKYYAWGYSHNIILEMTISFGIFGIAFLVWLIYRVIKIFWSNKDCRLVLIITLSMAARLLVSDSFWFNWAFWGLLAICISNRKSNGIKRRRK